MDPVTLLADAQIIASLIKLAIQLGQDEAPFVMRIISLVEGKAMTDAERADMKAKEQELRAQLQEPLPEGETDP